MTFVTAIHSKAALHNVGGFEISLLISSKVSRSHSSRNAATIASWVVTLSCVLRILLFIKAHSHLIS